MTELWGLNDAANSSRSTPCPAPVGATWPARAGHGPTTAGPTICRTESAMTALAVAVLAALAAVGVLITVSAWTTPPRPREPIGHRCSRRLLARADGAVRGAAWLGWW